MAKSLENWREPVIDPFDIKFNRDLVIKEIISYPHAGNDVFECFAFVEGERCTVYLKVERHHYSNFKNEAKALEKLHYLSLHTPELIDYDSREAYTYLVTKEILGERLSTILKKVNDDQVVATSIEYMREFGANLSKIHSLDLNWQSVPSRKFHDHLSGEFVENNNLQTINEWLIKNEPKRKVECFVHGDHHYANLLWDDRLITAVLDWELCGIGFKEFDIAWAMILRPSQQFLRSYEERQTFLEGYRQFNSYDEDALIWCEVLIYMHFYEIGLSIKDHEYTEFIKTRVKDYTEIGI